MNEKEACSEASPTPEAGLWYGDEDSNTPAQELYTMQDAETALFSAQQVIADCVELLNKL